MTTKDYNTDETKDMNSVNDNVEQTCANEQANIENPQVNNEAENNDSQNVNPEDVTVENPESEVQAEVADEAEAEAAGETEQIDPLAKALAEIEDLKTQMLYKQAEFENFRKRTIKEKADLILNGGEKTLKAILPVLDDFERAMTHTATTDEAVALKEGMELIYKKFINVLEGQGVKKIETADQDFNTDFHEAVALVPGMGDAMKGKIIDCVQTGYTLNDKVLRHAKVAVGQ